MSSEQSSARPRIRFRVAEQPRGVVIALHGGRETSVAGAQRWNLAAIRMWPFLRALYGAPVVTGMVQYRYRGWNGDSAHPVADALWAIERVQDRFGDLPIVLIGHSMGGRAAVRAAGAANVRGIAALAPWLPEGEPVEQLAGRTILIAHGNRERMTDPELSYAYARQARAVTDQVCYFDVLGAGHTMLRRPGDWHRVTTRFVLGILGIEPMHPEIANALREPEISRVPLSRQ